VLVVKRTDGYLLGLLRFHHRGSSGVLIHGRSLLINPASHFERGNVLDREVVNLFMNHMLIHELVQLVKIVKGHHGVAMVFGMIVGVPQENTNE
jgi:hypothetical protein